MANNRSGRPQYVEVPDAIWREESMRRQQIRGAAIAKARKEYNDKAEKWAKKQPKNYLNQIIGDERFPAFVAPGWGTIVAEGLNRTLDGLET